MGAVARKCPGRGGYGESHDTAAKMSPPRIASWEMLNSKRFTRFHSTEIDIDLHTPCSVLEARNSVSKPMQHIATAPKRGINDLAHHLNAGFHNSRMLQLDEETHTMLHLLPCCTSRYTLRRSRRLSTHAATLSNFSQITTYTQARTWQQTGQAGCAGSRTADRSTACSAGPSCMDGVPCPARRTARRCRSAPLLIQRYWQRWQQRAVRRAGRGAPSIQLGPALQAVLRSAVRLPAQPA